MLLKSIQTIAIIRRLIAPVLNKWVEKKVNRFRQFLASDAKILDVGSGNCLVSKHLIDKGHSVVPLDVKNLSVVPDLIPIVYDGARLPFDKSSFDTILLLTVLHHTKHPRLVLEDCQRVAKELIIIEDTYKHTLQKWATQCMDFLVNLGFSEMTYQNKSEKEWERLFAELGLEVVNKKSQRVLLFFRQTTYYLRSD